MKMKRTTSKEMALCGVLAALALTVMILGGMFPAASYCCPVLACILLVPVVETCGRRIAWAWYGAVALLSCRCARTRRRRPCSCFWAITPS